MAVQIAVANHKGGCGKTTLASHLLWWAAKHKLRAHGVAIDPQGNLIQRIINDPRLQRERVYRSDDWLELTYSPNTAPGGTFNADVVVFDFPPGFDICNIIQPHLWLVPVDGREAVDGLMTALRTMKVAAGGLGVYAVPNMLDGAGRIPVNAVRDALGKVSGIKVWPASIPDSGTIQRSAEFRAPTWRIPNGAGSAGDEAMQAFCTEVFRLTGLTRRGR